MTVEPIITVSGLRGIVDQSLTDEVCRRYAAAFVALSPPGPIVIGRDGRDSGPRFARAISETIVAAGREALDLGVAATPTVGVMVKARGAAGGIQISASHNPSEYNGLKLFSAAGRVLPAAPGEQVLEGYRTPPVEPREAGPPGRVASVEDAAAEHWALIAEICDRELLRRRRFRVVLDANHGAGSVLGRQVLEQLGCEATILGETPDGAFAHRPEPTEANLATVLQEVVNRDAAIGFCQDPDADRLAIIDERGRYIGEEKSLAICVDHVLRHGRRGPVVTNCSTSRMSEDLAAKYGVPFFRSKVGEANVVDVMLAQKAVIGGEGNGGVIDPRVVLVRDSFVGMALVLEAMASRNLPVSALADELPQYAIHKTTIAVPAEGVASALDAIEQHFSEASADRLDGLRLDWADGRWLLVRPSNTEPIVRAIAEAPTSDEAKRLCDAAAQAVVG